MADTGMTDTNDLGPRKGLGGYSRTLLADEVSRLQGVVAELESSAANHELEARGERDLAEKNKAAIAELQEALDAVQEVHPEGDPNQASPAEEERYTLLEVDKNTKEKSSGDDKPRSTSRSASKGKSSGK